MNINCTQYKNKEYFERLGISVFCRLEKKNDILSSFSHSTNQSPDWIDNNSFNWCRNCKVFCV